ncbi:MAG: NAD(P)-dependent oxidoreductase, partial [Candidatus Bathyarchaeia archaeon]
MPRGMKVLLTGASGRVGRAFREAYRGFYSLRLMCHQRSIEPSGYEEVVQADITDLNSVLKAAEGMEAVVHLAADPRVEAPWDSILNLNIIGTYNVFEAARRCGVKKVVFASSNHACGFAVEESDLVGPDTPVRPDSLYGVSKVFGEALGRYYSDRFGLSVICLRI